jgi:hypothetical protein
MASADADLFRSARSELFSAVIGDVMDKLGFQHQFLPPAIQPSCLSNAQWLCAVVP